MKDTFNHNGIEWKLCGKAGTVEYSDEYYLDGTKDGRQYTAIGSFAFGSEELEEITDIKLKS